MSQLVALMFTDIEGSTALRRKLGDHLYAETVLGPHNALFRDLLSRYPGSREIKNTGDGFLAIFKSVDDAVNAALIFQHEMRQLLCRIKVRVGIHLGQVLIVDGAQPDRNDIASHAADTCSRIMDLAVGGQILLSRHAFDDAHQFVREHPWVTDGAGVPELIWRAHGRYAIKGQDDPVEVFEVGAAGLAPLSIPSNTAKASRIDPLPAPIVTRPSRWRRRRWLAVASVAMLGLGLGAHSMFDQDTKSDLVETPPFSESELETVRARLNANRDEIARRLIEGTQQTGSRLEAVEMLTTQLSNDQHLIDVTIRCRWKSAWRYQYTTEYQFKIARDGPRDLRAIGEKIDKRYLATTETVIGHFYAAMQ